jgi:predicted RNA-binding Zn ribbon-like protein
MVPRLWDWLGDPLALDFANTVRRHGGEYRELLQSGEDVASWAEHESGRVPAVRAAEASGRLAEIRAVRDDVFAALRAASDGRPFPRDVARRLNARARAAPVVAQLGERPGEGVEHLPGDPASLDELLARVVHATIDLCRADDAGVALCDAPSCGQFFIRDRANQRWCGPACGTRARVARHAARRAH